MEQQAIPILFTDNLFIFPGCSQIINLERNEHFKKVLSTSLRAFDGQVLVVSSRKEVNQQELDDYQPLKFFNYGSLAKVKLDLQSSADIGIVFSYLSEVQLLGLERVQLVNTEKDPSNGV